MLLYFGRDKIKLKFFVNLKSIPILLLYIHIISQFDMGALGLVIICVLLYHIFSCLVKSCFVFVLFHNLLDIYSS